MKSGISYLVKLIDIPGYDIIKRTKNKKYPLYFRQDAIDRVLLNNESIWSVALDIYLPRDGMLVNYSKYIFGYSISKY